VAAAGTVPPVGLEGASLVAEWSRPAATVPADSPITSTSAESVTNTNSDLRPWLLAVDI
jgi:hypothetical protein